MQAITLEVILRAVFGVRDEERMDLLRTRIPRLAETSSVLTWLPFMQRDLGGLSPRRAFRKALAAVDELIYAEIADAARVGARARTCSRCCWRPGTRTAARCPTSSCATSS